LRDETSCNFTTAFISTTFLPTPTTPLPPTPKETSSFTDMEEEANAAPTAADAAIGKVPSQISAFAPPPAVIVTSFWEKFLKSKEFNSLMGILTIYALVGDDIRLAFYDMDDDQFFFNISIVALLLFILEVSLGVLKTFAFCFFSSQYLYLFFLERRRIVGKTVRVLTGKLCAFLKQQNEFRTFLTVRFPPPKKKSKQKKRKNESPINRVVRCVSVKDKTKQIYDIYDPLYVIISTRVFCRFIHTRSFASF